MSRFFVPSENISETQIKITGTDVKHIKNVLRAKVGDKLTACDSRDGIYETEIEAILSDIIICKIIATTVCVQEPKVPVILMQGVPKGEKFELIIQKNVELGINEIWPVLTERTIVKFSSDNDKEKKVARLARISEEAAKQCGRGVIPKVAPISDFKAAVKKACEYENYLKLIPYENEQDVTLKKVLQENFANGADSVNGAEAPGGIIIFIGPEGGFAQKEVDLCRENGFTAVTLGKRILRTETAGLAATAAIRYELGD